MHTMGISCLSSSYVSISYHCSLSIHIHIVVTALFHSHLHEHTHIYICIPVWVQFDPEESDGDMSLPTRDAEEFR